jgi:predicted transcriptional regulator
MIDAQKIIDTLKEEFNKGRSYNQMSRESGVSQPYICDLVNGRNKADGLTIRKINQLFPNATLTLNNSIVQNINSNTGTNYQIVGEKNFASPDKTLDQILNKVMENDKFTAEAKVEFFNIIKKFKG